MRQDRASLVKAVKSFAGRVKGPVRLLEFCRVMRVSTPTVYRYFPGGVFELLKAAGLEARVARIGRVDGAMLMAEVDRVAKELGRVPRRDEMIRSGRLSVSTFRNHVGRWGDVVGAYRKWKDGKAPARDVPTPRRLAAVRERMARRRLELKGRDASVGAPLGFRGVMHEPTTEMGVVHLFGVLAGEVDMAVEHVGSVYPDCRAVRREPDGKWRKVAVEFELRSSNFRAHGHDPKKCDVIVCWEDDWKGCPLEVIELKDVMRKAMAKGV